MNNRRQCCNSCGGQGRSQSNNNCNCSSNNGCENYHNECNQNEHHHCPGELDNKPIAMAYVPWQKWKRPLCASEGLANGSIFPDLILPFYGCRLRKDSNCQRGGMCNGK